MEQAPRISQIQTPDVSDVKPPEEFDEPASIIASSDYDTYEAHLARLQSTYSSGKYTVSSIKILMEETATIRRNWIREDKPPVVDIIQKFPCLKDPKFVSHLSYFKSFKIARDAKTVF